MNSFGQTREPFELEAAGFFVIFKIWSIVIADCLGEKTVRGISHVPAW